VALSPKVESRKGSMARSFRFLYRLKPFAAAKAKARAMDSEKIVL